MKTHRTGTDYLMAAALLVLMQLLAVSSTAFTTTDVYYVTSCMMQLVNVLHTRYATTCPATSPSLTTTWPLTPPSSSWKENTKGCCNTQLYSYHATPTREDRPRTEREGFWSHNNYNIITSVKV